MKITKDTKIGDIIPENSEICKANDDGAQKFCIEGVFVKHVKEKRDFKDYVIEYLNDLYENDLSRINTETPIFQEFSYSVLNNYLNNSPDIVPSEIKFGLFSTIAHEISDSLMDELNYYFTNKEFSTEIKRICPKEFLESIFK